MDLLYVWSIPLIIFSVGNNNNSDQSTLHLFVGFFLLHFPCPVFVRLEYCIWENQHFGNKNPPG